MLTARILNSNATYNTYNNIGTLEFIPGEQIRFVMQLTQLQHVDNIRYMTVAPATLTVLFPTKTGSITKILAPFSEDRSIWEVTLQESDTDQIVSGSINFDIDVLNDGTEIIKGNVQGAVSIIITGAC